MLWLGSQCTGTGTVLGNQCTGPSTHYLFPSAVYWPRFLKIFEGHL